MEAAELSIRGWVTALDADSRGGDSLAHRSSVSVSLCLIEVLTTFLLTVPSELGIRLAASPGTDVQRALAGCRRGAELGFGQPCGARGDAARGKLRFLR